MHQLWTTGMATLSGKHYQVDGAIGRPLPIQDGGIPLWIAGGGERKTLRIAAKYARFTNFDATPDVFRRKSEILARHCKDVGTDFGAIVRSSKTSSSAKPTQPTRLTRCGRITGRCSAPARASRH